MTYEYSPDFGALDAQMAVETLLGDLNPPQREAVIHAGSPLLVVAGAGSGKTRVLTRRIAYLIAARGVHPGEILAITFTNKAAAEMRGRVEELVGRRARLIWVSTFHSACLRMLRSDADKLGLARSFTIYDDTDQRRLVAAVTKRMGLDPKKFAPRGILTWISKCKDDLLDAAAANRLVTNHAAQGDRQPLEEVYADVYVQYERALRDANALDFDDLLVQAVRLLTDHADVREHYRRRFRHVLVDEYQDTNHAQYALIQALCSPDSTDLTPPELMVVGDSDQSIYAFRGANIGNILGFEDDFPGARTIVLGQNYRSTQTILNAANAVIAHNLGRPKKTLWSEAGDGAKITGWVGDTEYDEARFVTEEIAAGATRGQRYSDVAVFYRTNAQSRVVEEAFVRAGLPYRVLGGVRFYERKEVRDALAYLRALVNEDDDISTQRILNEPKRGIGDTTINAIADLARRQQISFGRALRRADEAGVTARAVKAIDSFVEMMDAQRTLIAEGLPADEVVLSVLDASGLADQFRTSKDPQDQSRVENLEELAHVAAEFVARAHTIDLEEEAPEPPPDDRRSEAQRRSGGMAGGSRFGLATAQTPADPTTHPDRASSTASGRPGPAGARLFGLERPPSEDLPTTPGAHVLADELAEGMPEPDDSLAGFLERIALASDTDALPDQGDGVVTLMTLHSAKGLEFDTVFLTGMEDGVFPHTLAMSDPSELSEERRLAYVGITRAKQHLYVTRAAVRTLFGQPEYNPASRFLDEIPPGLIAWRRVGAELTSWPSRHSSADQANWRRLGRRSGRVGSGDGELSWVSQWDEPTGTVLGEGRGQKPERPTGLPKARPLNKEIFAPGDRVIHDILGLGTVLAVRGEGTSAQADVDFGSSGTKRLAVPFAPMTKL
ncbi:MAG: UvrD-helicase domain-containing protein [Propionibacteriaceae bacterium]|nr:UvrD-helicase domain-containing protein [Propionibacteriaceae bacterium]